LDSLKKQNYEVLNKITKLDEKIKELDEQMIESKLFIEKLQSVENKLNKFKALESETYAKDSLLG
jgi:cell division protein FtsL